MHVKCQGELLNSDLRCTWGIHAGRHRKLIHLRLDGELVELLIKVDPSYQKFLTYEGKTPVIYTQLSKALYGTLQAALFILA